MKAKFSLTCDPSQRSPRHAFWAVALLTWLLFVTSSPSPAMSDERSIRAELDRAFLHYELLDVNLNAMARAAREEGALSLSIGRRTYALRLEVSDVRASALRCVVAAKPGTSTVIPVEPVATYRGAIATEPDSDARLLIHHALFFGLIRNRHQWIFLQPAYVYVRGTPASWVVAYSPEDLRAGQPALCGVEEPTGAATTLSLPAERSLIPRLLKFELATEADGEFYQLHGSLTNYYIEGLVNQANLFFERDLNLTFRISFQSVWTDPAADPYVALDLDHGLLEEFRNYWNINFRNEFRDLAHMFTGRGPTYGYVGLAGGITCTDLNWVYSASREITTLPYSVLVAHELAHHFAAVHDQGAICDGNGPIMCPGMQGTPDPWFSAQTEEDTGDMAVNLGRCAAFEPTSEASWSVRMEILGQRDELMSVAPLVDGGYLVAGATWLSEHYATPWVAIFDENGTLAVGRRFPNYSGDPGVRAIAVREHGTQYNYVTATAPDEIAGSGIWVAKLDTALEADATRPGTWERVYRIQGNSSWARDMTNSSSPHGESLYLAGETASLSDLGSTDVWFISLASSGEVTSSLTIGGAGAEVCNAMADLDGTPTLVGSTTSFGAGGEDAWVWSISGSLSRELALGGTGDESFADVAAAWQADTGDRRQWLLTGTTASSDSGSTDALVTSFTRSYDSNSWGFGSHYAVGGPGEDEGYSIDFVDSYWGRVVAGVTQPQGPMSPYGSVWLLKYNEFASPPEWVHVTNRHGETAIVEIRADLQGGYATSGYYSAEECPAGCPWVRNPHLSRHRGNGTVQSCGFEGPFGLQNFSDNLSTYYRYQGATVPSVLVAGDFSPSDGLVPSVASTCEIVVFRDGFESGDCSAWSNCVSLSSGKDLDVAGYAALH